MFFTILRIILIGLPVGVVIFLLVASAIVSAAINQSTEPQDDTDDGLWEGISLADRFLDWTVELQWQASRPYGFFI